MSRYSGAPATGLLFWLCLPIVLVYAAGTIAYRWFRLHLCPHARPSGLHCRDCGWGLAPDTASLICPPCQEQRRQASAKLTLTKLFCCDVDVIYFARKEERHCGRQLITDRYCCPTCGRIWLYITEWHKDSGRAADWYPQQTKADGGTVPDLYDERTWTKVYH